jgi:repressor LexA
MKELTVRQKEVLSLIAEFINAHSYPPTVREVAEHFGMSVKGAHDHITALKRKGHINYENKRPRTMELLHAGSEKIYGMISIPILGSVAAGKPLLTEENFDGNILLHHSMLKKNKKYFALKVKGDSMSGAGILDGDTAVIEKCNTAHNGEIVVAAVEDAFTIKRFFHETSRIKLQSENPEYKPIFGRDIKIFGKLSTIIRSY